MGKKWPHENVSATGAILPDKLYTVKVIEGEETESRAGKYAIALRTRVISPEKFKNRPFNFTFYIGTDDDLGADEEETWTTGFAASRYKSFLMAAEVADVGDVEEELEEAAGKRLVVDAGHHVDAESGKKYQDANGFFKEGEQEDEDAPSAPSKGKSKVEEVEEDEEEEEEVPAPKVKAAKGKPAKKAAKDDDWD